MRKHKNIIKEGIIQEGIYQGWRILIQDDRTVSGGWLILIESVSPPGVGYDNWVEENGLDEILNGYGQIGWTKPSHRIRR